MTSADCFPWAQGIVSARCASAKRRWLGWILHGHSVSSWHRRRWWCRARGACPEIPRSESPGQRFRLWCRQQQRLQRWPRPTTKQRLQMDLWIEASPFDKARPRGTTDSSGSSRLVPAMVVCLSQPVVLLYRTICSRIDLDYQSLLRQSGTAQTLIAPINTRTAHRCHSLQPLPSGQDMTILTIWFSAACRQANHLTLVYPSQKPQTLQ